MLPDRVLDAVLDQLPATHQRRAGWLARSFPPMNSTFFVSALVPRRLSVLVLGYQFLQVAGPEASVNSNSDREPNLRLQSADVHADPRTLRRACTIPAGVRPGRPDVYGPAGGRRSISVSPSTWRSLKSGSVPFIVTVYRTPVHQRASSSWSIGPSRGPTARSRPHGAMACGLRTSRSTDIPPRGLGIFEDIDLPIAGCRLSRSGRTRARPTSLPASWLGRIGHTVDVAGPKPCDSLRAAGTHRRSPTSPSWNTRLIRSNIELNADTPASDGAGCSSPSVDVRRTAGVCRRCRRAGPPRRHILLFDDAGWGRPSPRSAVVRQRSIASCSATHTRQANLIVRGSRGRTERQLVERAQRRSGGLDRLTHS
jgi:hypothetical protein